MRRLDRIDVWQRVAHGAFVFSVSLGLLWGEEANRGDIIAIASVEKLRFVRPTGSCSSLVDGHR